MKEEQLNKLREQDNNLREAIQMSELELPQMPADLNARLMQRVAQEKPSKARTRIIWPWIAAACVAAVIAVFLTPPKDTTGEIAQVQESTAEQLETVIAKQEPKVAEISQQEPEVATPEQMQVAEVKRIRKASVMVKEPISEETICEVPTTEEPLLAQETAPAEEKATERNVTLSEHDIPITRPENLKYTPEEMALLKKQANEAYLKWVELELEISKHYLQQTAQQ